MNIDGRDLHLSYFCRINAGLLQVPCTNSIPFYFFETLTTYFLQHQFHSQLYWRQYTLHANFLLVRPHFKLELHTNSKIVTERSWIGVQQALHGWTPPGLSHVRYAIQDFRILILCGHKWPCLKKYEKVTSAVNKLRFLFWGNKYPSLIYSLFIFLKLRSISSTVLIY